MNNSGRIDLAAGLWGIKVAESADDLKAALANSDPLAVGVWPRLLGVDQLAVYLGMAPQTIRNNADRIPGRRHLGRRVLWDKNIVDRWIDRNDGTRDLWIDARAITQ